MADDRRIKKKTRSLHDTLIINTMATLIAAVVYQYAILHLLMMSADDLIVSIVKVVGITFPIAIPFYFILRSLKDPSNKEEFQNMWIGKEYMEAPNSKNKEDCYFALCLILSMFLMLMHFLGVVFETGMVLFDVNPFGYEPLTVMLFKIVILISGAITIFAAHVLLLWLLKTTLTRRAMQYIWERKKEETA